MSQSIENGVLVTPCYDEERSVWSYDIVYNRDGKNFVTDNPKAAYSTENEALFGGLVEAAGVVRMMSDSDYTAEQATTRYRKEMCIEPLFISI